MNPATTPGSTPDDELQQLLVDDLNAFERAGAGIEDFEPAPHDLGRTMLLAALAVRPHGAPIGPSAATPADAFHATVADLDALIGTLDDNELESPCLSQYGRVRDLVAHLAGVEEQLVRGLERPLGDGMAPPMNHVEGTRLVIDELSESPAQDVTDRWHSGATRLLKLAVASEPARPVMVGTMPTDVDGLLVLRTFELWTHLEDICAAIGRATPGLDAPRFALMSSRLVQILPTAVLLTQGDFEKGTIRFVLTGAGGGTYDRAFSPEDRVTAPDAVIITDVADICRAASNRMTRERLPVTIEGNAELAERVLASIGALAQD